MVYLDRNPTKEKEEYMNIVIMVHTEQVCKEYVLPRLDNTDYAFVLSKQIFGFSRSEIVYMENVDGIWSFREHPFYCIGKHGISYEGVALQDGDILEYVSKDGNRAAMIVYPVKKRLQSFEKFDVSQVEEITFGKERDNTICYDFYGLVSRHHGRLYRQQGEWIVEDLSANGIFLEEQRIRGKTKVSFGTVLTAFGLQMVLLNHVLCVSRANDVSVDESLQPFVWSEQNIHKEKKYLLTNGKNNTEFYHRSPRTMPVLYRETMLLDFLLEEEQKANKSKASKGMFHIPLRRNKIVKKKSETEEGKWFLQQEQMKKIREMHQKNQRILRENYPSATVCCDYGINTTSLWNRNFSHNDILFLRLGLGTQKLGLTICVPEQLENRTLKEQGKTIKEQYETLTEVPVGIDLYDHRLLGIVGGAGKIGAYQIARLLLTQICANICYTDVKIAVVYEERAKEEREVWEAVKWTPHIWNEEKSMRFFATNKEEARNVFHELRTILRKRKEKRKYAGPHYVLFLSDPKLLEGELLENYIYENKEEYGITTCFLVENFEDLPNCCEQILEKDEDFQGMYHVRHGMDKRQNILFDSVPKEKMDCFFRRLACIRIKEDGKNLGVPKHLEFLEMYGAEKIEELKIYQRWRKGRTFESMKVPIGKKSGDRLCCLDLHEKYHGPHGLIAGTTGAGKSEMIQTFILSLALNFSPQDIAFLLIDYKGGGMANLFEKLPHLAGKITNLSGNQVGRVLVSIGSEVKRRQKLLQEHQCNHIHAYTRLVKHGEHLEPLQHLIIIVDEFAELKKEEPEFMDQLISVAQLGRSLGVHLILATQKPSGTVDEKIWSNSRFRICLKVQDEKDSMEVLKTEDAVTLNRQGQGYLQVGSILVICQD